MAATNPYASHLSSRDPLSVLPATPKKLRALADALGSKHLQDSLAPGKWSVREILCHLADCEIAFGFRLRQALAEDHHVIQPFDQELWAKNYSGFDAATALAAFHALRDWNVKLISAAKPQSWNKKVSHPERGEMTFKTLVDTMAGHDLNHLQQVETIAAKAGVAKTGSA